MKTNSTGNNVQQTSQMQSHDPLQQRLSTVSNIDLEHDANQESSVQNDPFQSNPSQYALLQEGSARRPSQDSPEELYD